MLAREYCVAAKIKRKPIILSHHMLYGLKAGQEKMSKSDPDSAVFMEDSEEDVRRKIMAAYCPSKKSTDTETKKAETVDAGKILMLFHCYFLEYKTNLYFLILPTSSCQTSCEYCKVWKVCILMMMS